MTASATRPATQADLPHIHRLVRGLAEYERMLDRFTVTEARLAHLLFGPRPFASAALAEADGASVGVAIWYYTTGTFTGHLGLFLEDLFVEPAHRGRGLGLALFRHIASVARAQDCATIEWRVLTWNQPSIDFYHRLGATRLTDWHTMELRGDALAALAQGASND
jgi:GNAT superfamily N-acetyltransferase